MKIEFLIDSTVIALGVLEDNATARDFATLLPVSLRLVDYDDSEKIADLPCAPTTAGAPQSSLPIAGDISFYAPWGNLAIFYRDGVVSEGLVLMGRLVSGIQAFERLGPLHVMITLAQPSHP